MGRSQGNCTMFLLHPRGGGTPLKRRFTPFGCERIAHLAYLPTCTIDRHNNEPSDSPLLQQEIPLAVGIGQLLGATQQQLAANRRYGRGTDRGRPLHKGKALNARKEIDLEGNGKWT